MSNENVILDMLTQSQKNSTKIDNNNIDDKLTFKRDENGNLSSYDKETGKKVGRIYEHGNEAPNNVAKTFSEIIRRE